MAMAMTSKRPARNSDWPALRLPAFAWYQPGPPWSGGRRTRFGRIRHSAIEWHAALTSRGGAHPPCHRCRIGWIATMLRWLS